MKRLCAPLWLPNYEGKRNEDVSNYLKDGTGEAWPGQVKLDGCPALTATRSMELVENLGTADPTGSGHR